MNRISFLLISLMMILFGGFQFNDPDPLLWISIYWLVALLGVLVYFEKAPNSVIQIVLIGLVIYASTFIPDLIGWIKDGFPTFTGKMSKGRPYTELMREFFGLVISVAATIYLLKHNKRSTIK